MLKEMLDINFWFSNQGPSSILELSLWTGVFTFFALLGVILLIYNKFIVRDYPPKNKILKPMGIVLIVTAVSAELFVLLNWQGIDFLGVRAIEIVFILFILAWIAFLSLKYIREVPSESVKYEAKKIKQKYS